MTATKLPDPDYENILDYFPLEDFRKGQKDILLQFKEYLLDPSVSHIICQAATGTGKSALALAAARASRSAYIATANKMLQDQYVKDFSDIMVNLKGRANYECYAHQPPIGKPNYNCGNSPCRSSQESRAACAGMNLCGYHRQREKAVAANITSFNFAAALPYLNHLSHLFPPRNLLICDEAHSVWSWLTNFIGVNLNLKLLESVDVLDYIPNYECLDQYLELINKVQNTVAEYLTFKDLDSALVEKLESLQNRLQLFDIITDNKKNIDNFILDKRFDVRDYTKIINLSFKPVDVANLLHDYFFKHAKKTILLSAVILDFDTYMDLMGIDPAKARVIVVDSTFPVENRPIYTYEAVGRLNRSNLESYIPDICFKIDELLRVYSNVKGIVHGVSWNLCTKIYNGLSDKTRDRILFAGWSDRNEPTDQTMLINFHEETDEPTILLSPSMSEGVDLKGSLSHIQIIAKMPYPSLGDPITLKRMKLKKNFYPMLTAQTIVNMYGRSIRSETDICDTYILDSSFLRFVENNFKILPKSFINAIIRREAKFCPD